MGTFDHPNYSTGFECPVCHTGADQPVTLVPIPGTEDGGIVECKQVHAECWELVLKMSRVGESK